MVLASPLSPSRAHQPSLMSGGGLGRGRHSGVWWRVSQCSGRSGGPGWRCRVATGSHLPRPLLDCASWGKRGPRTCPSGEVGVSVLQSRPGGGPMPLGDFSQALLRTLPDAEFLRCCCWCLGEGLESWHPPGRSPVPSWLVPQPRPVFPATPAPLRPLHPLIRLTQLPMDPRPTTPCAPTCPSVRPLTHPHPAIHVKWKWAQWGPNGAWG